MLITYLKSKFANWKEQRFLKKHGCETRAQYERWYDPDYNQRATRINDYYCGYPHWTVFENHNHQIYYWDMAYDGSSEIIDWCKENLTDKFRFDGLRVIRPCPATTWHWETNEIGGRDYMFFACKNPEDMIMFKLRWM